MKTTAEYLDAVKMKKNIDSDYALAKILGIRRSKIVHYRRGTVVMQAIDMLTVSEILGIPVSEVLAEIQASQGKTEAERTRWANFLRRLPEIAAGVALIVVIFGGGVMRSGETQASVLSDKDSVTGYYAKSRSFGAGWWQRRFGRVKSWLGGCWPDSERGYAGLGQPT